MHIPEGEGVEGGSGYSHIQRTIFAMQSHNVDLAAPKLPEWNVTKWRQTRSIVCIWICMSVYVYLYMYMSVYVCIRFLVRLKQALLLISPSATRQARTPSALLWSGVNMTEGEGGGRGLAGLGEEGLGTLGWGISSSGQTQPPTPNCYRLPLGAAFVIVTKAISSISKTVILWCFLYCFLPFCCYLIKNQSSKDKVSWLHLNVRQISAFVKVILWYCGHEMK